jgi:hypothetical protein
MEMILAKEICKSRNNDEGLRREMKVSNDPDIIFNGYCGELAFCKLFNCYPDFTTEIQSNALGTDKADVILNGKNIDIKTTKYKTGNLVVKRTKKINGDYFALMVGTAPMFEFKGFKRQCEVITPERLIDFHGVPSYVVPASELISDNVIELRGKR